MSFDLRHLGTPIPDFDTVIDVRSPSEYREDHVPGAINLPVLSDEERARVGTIYVQESTFLARKIGAALVARNAASHIEGPLADRDGGWRPLVYCWRGGQRSGSFASILAQIGWRAEVLNGGYQSYRRLVVQSLYDAAFPTEVILLDGNTGTAKTALLGLLRDRNVQVIDLEGLANHRGSALGEQGDQPSQKAFESRLAAEVVGLDPDRPVVIEAESSKIGELNVPPSVFKAMKAAPRFFISAPVAARARFLTDVYKDITDNFEDFSDRLDLLTRLQGREKIARWKAMAGDGDLQELAAELIRDHYDPRYNKTREARGAGVDTVFETPALDTDALSALADRLTAAITSRVG